MTDRKRDRAQRQVNRLYEHLLELTGAPVLGVTYTRDPAGSPTDTYAIHLNSPTMTAEDDREFRSSRDFDSLDRLRPQLHHRLLETARRVMRRRAVHQRHGTRWDTASEWPTPELYAHPLAASILIHEIGGRETSPAHLGRGLPGGEVTLAQDAIILKRHPAPGRPAWITSTPRETTILIDQRLPEVVLAGMAGKPLGCIAQTIPTGWQDIDEAVTRLVIEHAEAEGDGVRVHLAPADWLIYGERQETTNGPLGQPYRAQPAPDPISTGV